MEQNKYMLEKKDIKFLNGVISIACKAQGVDPESTILTWVQLRNKLQTHSCPKPKPLIQKEVKPEPKK